MSKLSMITAGIKKSVIDHSPAILSAIGAMGVVTTAVLTAKATRDATLLVEEVRQERGYASMPDDAPMSTLPDPVEFTVVEIVRMTGKFYIPAVSTGIVAVACIFGAHSINYKRQAALIGAYSMLDRNFDEYKGKALETLGVTKEEKLREDVAKERIAVQDVPEMAVREGQQLCYDMYTGRYFMSDAESIRQAVNDLNSQINNDFYASLNDFHQLLDLSITPAGEELGWRSERLLEVRFTSTLTPSKKPVLAIEYAVEPIRNYRNAH